MSENPEAGGAMATVHRFPRKLRAHPHDRDDAGDIRRLVNLRLAVRHLAATHGDLHRIFGEVVAWEDKWPFYAVRQLQAYVEKDDLALLTKNPGLLSAARTVAAKAVATNMGALGKALLAETGLTLTAQSGHDLRADPALLKRNEKILSETRDVVAQASPGEQAALARVTRVTQHSLRSMYNLGGSLSQVGQSALARICPQPPPSADEPDPEYLPPRRRHLRLAQHWLMVSASQLQAMKLDLIADYADEHRARRAEHVTYQGLLLEVTPPQRDFVEADAGSHRHLRRADQSVTLALTH